MDGIATRLEKVVLDLEDRFAEPLLRDAAAVAVLRRELGGLSGQSVQTNRSMRDTEQQVNRTARAAEQGGNKIDRLSGRLELLTRVAAVLGPGLVPIAAVGIPAVAGLAEAMGAVALGAGTMLFAMNGVGDALKALNKASLDPTAANLQAANLAMEKISPSARQFVRELSAMAPELSRLRQAAGKDMFPGLTEGLHNAEKALPVVQKILEGVGGEIGQLASDAGKSLGGSEWRPFLQFVEREAPQALDDLANSAGSLAHGLAELLMAFAPTNRDLLGWIRETSAAFDDWATHLDQTQGFQDFLDYLSRTGPQVGKLVGDLAHFTADLAAALAPLGGPTLHALDAIVKVLDAIVSSPLGTPLLAVIQINSALRLTSSLLGKVGIQSKLNLGPQGMVKSAREATSAIFGVVSAQERATAKAGELEAKQRKAWGTVGKGAAVVGGLAVAYSGLADNIGLSNSVNGALIGSLTGPWGAAIGGSIGLLLDARDAAQQYADALASIDTQASVTSSNRQLDALMEQAQRAYDNRSFFERAANSIGSRIAGTVNNPFAFSNSFNIDRDKLNGTIAGLKSLELQTGPTENGLHLLTRGMGISSHATEVLGASMDDVAAKFSHMTDVLAGRAAMRDYQAAIDAVTDAVKKNGRTLDINTAKGRENQTALDNIANTSIAVAEHMKPLQRQRFLVQARQDFINAATDLGMTDKAARHLADKLGLLKKPQPINVDNKDANRNLDDTSNKAHRAFKDPFNLTVDGNTHDADSKVNSTAARARALFGDPFHLTVNAETSQARNDIAILQRQVDALHGKTIIIRTVGGHTVQGNADGGTIAGQRYPYGDKVLSWLAPGEEVISNRHGQADRFRADRAAGRIPGYADGGTVGRPMVRDPFAVTSMPNLEHTVREWQKAIDASRQSIAAERAQRDALRQRAAQLSSGIRDSFRSDLWGSTGSPWGGGSSFASGQSALMADVKNARAFRAALKQLRAKGVKGAAFAEIAASGNLEEAQAYASQSRSDLRDYSRLYAERQRVTSNVGQYAAQVRYGKQLEQQDAHLREMVKTAHSQEKQLKAMERELKHLQKELASHPERTGHAAGNAVNRGARAGVRKAKRYT